MIIKMESQGEHLYNENTNRASTQNTGKTSRGKQNNTDLTLVDIFC